MHVVASLDGRMACTSLRGYCDLDLLSKIIVSGVYFYIIRGRNPIFGV